MTTERGVCRRLSVTAFMIIFIITHRTSVAVHLAHGRSNRLMSPNTSIAGKWTSASCCVHVHCSRINQASTSVERAAYPEIRIRDSMVTPTVATPNADSCNRSCDPKVDCPIRGVCPSGATCATQTYIETPLNVPNGIASIAISVAVIRISMRIVQSKIAQ
jgi:hypothetical protein